MIDREHLPETDEYNCLDLLKFICCILVAVIHTEPLKSINEAADYYLTNYAARFAVPFFFITSGFLAFRKTDVNLPDPTLPLKCAGKNFRMYVLWTAIYLPIICYTVSIYEGGTAKGILYQICRFFFTGRRHSYGIFTLLLRSCFCLHSCCDGELTKGSFCRYRRCAIS